MLEQKAMGAIKAYDVDIVVANLLQTHKHKVVVFCNEKHLDKEEAQAKVIQVEHGQGKDVEEKIVDFIDGKWKSYRLKMEQGGM